MIVESVGANRLGGSHGKQKVKLRDRGLRIMDYGIRNQGFRIRSRLPARDTAGLIEKNTKEWILISKKLIRQDLQDYQETAAFSRKASRQRRKYPGNPV